MTYNEFEKYAFELKFHSDTIDDDWTICEYQNSMVTQRVQCFNLINYLTFLQMKHCYEYN